MLSFSKKVIIWLWGTVGTVVVLAFLSLNGFALYDYTLVNSIHTTTLFTDTGKETFGLVELINSLYYQAFIQGKVLSLFKFDELPLSAALLLYAQFALLLVGFLYDANTSHNKTTKLMNNSGFVLLALALVSINVNEDITWSNINTPQLLHVQTLYEFGYWGSIEYWISQLDWTGFTWALVLTVLVYTLVKAHIIVTTFHTNKPKHDLKRLILGCSMATFAPYRLTQGFTKTEDNYSNQLMASVRLKTLTTFKIKPHMAVRINKALASEETGLIGLTDLSATYIPLFLQPKNK